ncbi:hypothetical protein UY3_11150 [Chelonia mydas]|uniref:Uncharacterized protein n=1 Tax=Chelonia mydas TaxID=8469 RepID=M7B1H6_CHEMY|nr:hypothetical protein UY3_11150 [Chelonia mydas]
MRKLQGSSTQKRDEFLDECFTSVYEDEEPELQVPVIPMGASSSFPDSAVTRSPSLVDDHWQNQELLQRVTNDLEIPLEEVQDLQRPLLDILQSQGPRYRGSKE